MKTYKIICAVVLLSVLIMSGCQDKLTELPDNPIRFKSGILGAENEDTGYKTIEYDNKTYIVFGSIKAKGISGDISYAYGNCLGYVDDDKSDRIYELKGESTDEWLIEYYVGGIMNEPVILREITARGNDNIPSSVESFDYDYWKE